MKNLTLIAAIGKNYELGYQNQLLWNIPEDMKFFRENTLNKPIVMGRKTLESLPKKLPNRTHIVLTRNMDITFDKEIKVYHNTSDLLSFLETLKQEIMVIGGAQIYSELLPYADKMLLTEIDCEQKLADVFFPKFEKEEWNYETIKEDVYENIKYKRLVYTRKDLEGV